MLIELNLFQFIVTVDRETVEKVTAVCHGIVVGVEMPFPLPNPNGCLDSGLECPLKKDVNYSYVTALPVLKSYPKVFLSSIALLNGVLI